MQLTNAIDALRAAASALRYASTALPEEPEGSLEEMGLLAQAWAEITAAMESLGATVTV